MQVKLIKQSYRISDKHEHYKLEYNEEKVENRRLRHKPGVIVFLRELFQKLEVKFEAYWSSVKFFINGKDYIVFQNTGKTGIEWFHFSDKFKGRNIKSFLRRMKKFLMEKIGNHIKEIFEKMMFQLDKYLGNLKDDVKEVIKSKLKYTKPVKKVFFIDNTFHVKYYGLIRMAFKRGTSKITINVAEEFYNDNKDKFMKAIKEIAENLYEIYGKDVHDKLLVIRQRPAWLIV